MLVLGFYGMGGKLRYYFTLAFSQVLLSLCKIRKHGMYHPSCWDRWKICGLGWFGSIDGIFWLDRVCFFLSSLI